MSCGNICEFNAKLGGEILSGKAQISRIMDGDIEEIENGFARITLGPTQGRTFLECASERVTQCFGEQWKDRTKKVAYRWPSSNLGEMFVDDAEEVTLKSFCDPRFCELLGEPVYVISGGKTFFL